MKRVTKGEFYSDIGQRDVIFAPESRIEKTIWMTRHGVRVGECFDTLNDHGRVKYPIERNYFIY